MPKLYFAYGSNLNLLQFYQRCPKARPFCQLDLPDFSLVFRRVADICDAPGESVPGAIYKITRQCEDALDIYEGFPSLYTKRFFHIQTAKGKVMDVMFYVMNSDSISPPSDQYFNIIQEGYHDWNIPTEGLFAAAKRSKQPTQKQRRAHTIRHAEC